jgi:hypothetical protein
VYDNCANHAAAWALRIWQNNVPAVTRIHIYVMLPSMRRTTIFLPDELHEQLRQHAFRGKTSMAELIRTELQRSMRPARKSRPARDPILKVAGVCSGPVLSSDIDRDLYGG